MSTAQRATLGAGLLAVALLLAAALARPAAASPAEARALAERIVVDGDLPDATAATREVLARAGIPTRAGDRTLVPAAGPAALVSLTDLETLEMAAEARHGETFSRMTLAQYARALKRMGFPFRRGRPDRAMVRLLRDWARGARRRPRDPSSFTALFLAEMARLKRPAVDLRRGRYPARRLGLTLLEAQLLTATFLRFEGRARRTATGRAGASGPCTDVRKGLEASSPLIGRGVAFAAERMAGKLLQKLVAEMLVSPRDRRTLRDPALRRLLSARARSATTAASLLFRAQKLAAFYGAIRIGVVPRRPAVTASPSATLGEAFGALVGFDPAELESYRRELAQIDPASTADRRGLTDCATALGLPAPPDPEALAGELDSYRLHWRFEELRRGTARVNLRTTKEQGYDFPHTRVQRIGPHEARAVLAIDVLPGPRGRRSTAIGACADLDASQTPTFRTFVNPLFGRLSGSVQALVAEWIRATVTPSACNVMDVHYEAEHTFDVTMTGSQESAWDSTTEIASNSCTPSGQTITQQGRQLLAFATPAPARVTFTRRAGGGDYILSVAGRPAGSGAGIEVAGSIERQSTTSVVMHGPTGSGCAEGTPGEADNSRDCGTRPVAFRARMAVDDDGDLVVDREPGGDTSWGFRRCPGRGAYTGALLEAAARLDERAVSDPGVSPLLLNGARRFRESLNRSSPSATTSGHVDHRVTWSARLSRVEPGD